MSPTQQSSFLTASRPLEQAQGDYDNRQGRQQCHMMAATLNTYNINFFTHKEQNG